MPVWPARPSGVDASSSFFSRPTNAPHVSSRPARPHHTLEWCEAAWSRLHIPTEAAAAPYNGCNTRGMSLAGVFGVTNSTCGHFQVPPVRHSTVSVHGRNKARTLCDKQGPNHGAGIPKGADVVKKQPGEARPDLGGTANAPPRSRGSGGAAAATWPRSPQAVGLILGAGGEREGGPGYSKQSGGRIPRRLADQRAGIPGLPFGVPPAAPAAPGGATRADGGPVALPETDFLAPPRAHGFFVQGGPPTSGPTSSYDDYGAADDPAHPRRATPAWPRPHGQASVTRAGGRGGDTSDIFRAAGRA